MDKIIMPEDVIYIISEIEKAGFEAYAVGGCIRDSLLGRTPNDWDITTSAKPKDIKDIFRRTIDTGIQHGTVTVMLKETGYEITTFRIDGEYEDGRHPKEVSFTASLEEDLKRRDFTINALAYNDSKGLVDLFNGVADMQKGIIRCVGVASERFTEDALRIMRAIRFAGQLGYEIEADTFQAMKDLAPNLKKVSAERIQVELTKLLVSDHPELLKQAYEAGITNIVFPEFDECMRTPQNHPHHCYDVGNHILETIKHTPPKKTVRFAALFHDIGKPPMRTVDEQGMDHFKGHPQKSALMQVQIMKRLKFDNDTIHRVKVLVEYHDCVFPKEISKMRKLITKIGLDAFPELFELKRADILAQSLYLREEKEANLQEAFNMYETILKNKDCLSLKELAISGFDLIQIGIPKGKFLGEVLQKMLDIVLEEPEKNEKEYLLKQAEKYYTTCFKS